jgi:HSP20 family protein
MSDYATRNLYKIIRSQPATNIKENQEGFVIELAAPGLDKDDFKLKIEKNILTIQSEKKHEQADAMYSKQEFAYNEFVRSFSLPQSADTEKISATYHQGILIVNIPRLEECKPKPVRTIEIH